MKFDFTPDPKVLLALTQNPMKPIDALCELIDNAIDSFHSAKIQGVSIENPMVLVTLPRKKDIRDNSGVLRVQDNGPGMTAEVAERSIKAGFSGNNPYDTLGLFGMGFNISTGKLGNKTVLMTSRKDADTYIKTEIDLNRICQKRDYSLDVIERKKGDSIFDDGGHGTILEISDWWPEGNANYGFVKKLVDYGQPKIREEVGRIYATILRKGEIKILINEKECEPFEHCVWDESRFVVRNKEQIHAKIYLDHTIKQSKRCGKCTTLLGSTDTVCPVCGSSSIRTIEEKVTGWVGIQRFDSSTDYGIDLIRNGRAIRVGEKSAFFEYTDDLKHTTKDYPIDSPYGRIVGEINLDFVPVDFLKQDFQRSTPEWQSAMEYIRGSSSLQPSQPGASENNSPIYRLYQGYRRVRNYGRADMYMGYWDADSRSAKRISRGTEQEYYKRFKEKQPGYYDDSEWWKLVETADQPPAEALPECPECGAQHLKNDEICPVCGAILKGKACINCGKEIPESAVSCPHCGSSQIPVIIEPWRCKICGTKNLADNDICKSCGSVRGANNPLDREELLATSVKVDSLSSAGLSIDLPNGKKSSSLGVQVYSVTKPLITPIHEKSIPLVIFKDGGKIEIFVDLSHPIFIKCGLSQEQLIASEIAQYIYLENMHLVSNNQGFNLGNLTWDVLQTNWKDSIEIDSETVLKDVEALLSEIRDKIRENNGANMSDYFEEMSVDQKKMLTGSMIQHGIDLSTIKQLKDSGEYLLYAPYSFLYTLYQEDPELFFNGKVWKVSLANGGEELLGSEVVNQIRKKLINQYDNYLHDLILFVDNKFTDITTLQRVGLSIKFLRKELVV